MRKGEGFTAPGTLEPLVATAFANQHGAVHAAGRALLRLGRVDHVAVQTAVRRRSRLAGLSRILRPEHLGSAFRARLRADKRVFHNPSASIAASCPFPSAPSVAPFPVILNWTASLRKR